LIFSYKFITKHNVSNTIAVAASVDRFIVHILYTHIICNYVSDKFYAFITIIYVNKLFSL